MNLYLPFNGRVKVTSPFGWRELNGQQDFHRGIDLVGIDDITVIAPCDGVIGTSTILDPKTDKTLTWQFGNYIRLDTDDNMHIFMCHLDSRAVKRGDFVKRGDTIGIMGNTGYSFGAHCHFEVRDSSGTSVNPAPYLGIKNAVGVYQTEQTIKDTEDKSMDETKRKPDSEPAEWAKEAVEWATENGIMYGDGTGDLKLHSDCTREQMIVFLYRLYNMLK